MNKRFVFTCLLVFLMVTSVSYCKDIDNNYIKVGLKRATNDNNSINIVCEDITTVGQLDSDGNFTNIIDNLNINNFNVQIDKYLHIEIKKDFRSYEEAVDFVNSNKRNGINLFIVYDGNFKVWCNKFNDISNAKSYESKLDYINHSKKVVNGSGTRMILIDNNQNIRFAYNLKEKLYLKNTTVNKISVIGVTGKKYRGYISFGNKEGLLIPINTLKLNEYLYGVVAKEISSTWPIESIKAQAVAARNYGAMYIGKGKAGEYDLDDTQNSQSYEGYSFEKAIINKAIDDTKDVVIKYKGEIVPTYYHSNSGGHTEDSENVWGGYEGYIRGVEDEFSIGSPSDTWELVLNKEQINEKLLASGYDLGAIKNIEIIEASKYGRVQQLLIEGSKDKAILIKGKARLVFGTTKIKSAWFEVSGGQDSYVFDVNSGQITKTAVDNKKILNSKGNNDIYIYDGNETIRLENGSGKYTFTGKGYGHGIGMSQWGSKAMAEQGYDYKAILKHYYTDITIVQE
ncbi:SpoIID/LytB domain-containing protein [Clostridiaceae bacterium M8S5]|nr:SpoIID/LytB domain-containing protein [Clostridiaceae bacterium M8S5]